MHGHIICHAPSHHSSVLPTKCGFGCLAACVLRRVVLAGNLVNVCMYYNLMVVYKICTYKIGVCNCIEEYNIKGVYTKCV